MSLPSKETLRLFLDKKSFYKLSMERGFPLPRTWFTDGVHDIDAIAREIECPCLIKPFQPNATWRETFDTRLFLADSPEMLKELYALIYPVHQDLLIQEYMPGDGSQACGASPISTRQRRSRSGRPEAPQYPRGYIAATLAEPRDPSSPRPSTSQPGRPPRLQRGRVQADRRDGKRKITEAPANTALRRARESALHHRRPRPARPNSSTRPASSGSTRSAT
jgi:hypothetical protein